MGNDSNRFAELGNIRIPANEAFEFACHALNAIKASRIPALRALYEDQIEAAIRTAALGGVTSVAELKAVGIRRIIEGIEPTTD